MASDPRAWPPPEGTDPSEQADSDAGYRRRSAQIAALIRWGWVAMFVLVGIAIVVGARCGGPALRRAAP